jgi:multiple sugar transport system permease protein
MSQFRKGFQTVFATLAVTILVAWACLQIFPFLFTIANSFKCLPAIRAEPQAIIPASFDTGACEDAEGFPLAADELTTDVTFTPALQGYEEIFDQNIDRWILNTAFIAAGVTFARVIFDSMAGYALARLKFPGSRVLFYVVLGTMMIPAIVLLIPRFIILKEMGWINTYAAITIPFFASPFGIFLMKQFFESIPGEIEEAAKVDGASNFTIFYRIALPMASPALIAATIFSFQGMWNEFVQVLVLVATEPDLWTLPLGLAFFRGQFGETLRWHAFLAGAVIATLPLALIFFMFQRYFVEGVSYSGLKG